jgi:hypothetical protein
MERLETICVGGPLHGMLHAQLEHEEKFQYSRIKSGCEVLAGDYLVGGFQPEYEHHHYHLFHVCIPMCPLAVWEYFLWLHHSLSIVDAIEHELFHPSDCYVVRFMPTTTEYVPSPVFQYGLVKLSVN